MTAAAVEVAAGMVAEGLVLVAAVAPQASKEESVAILLEGQGVWLGEGAMAAVVMVAEAKAKVVQEGALPAVELEAMGRWDTVAMAATVAAVVG